jgi:ATP-dependent DNA helicase RecQ
MRPPQSLTPAVDLESVTEKEEAREFAVGERVGVPARGEGRVKAVDGDKLTIVFPDGETRIFKSEFVERRAGGGRTRRTRG